MSSFIFVFHLAKITSALMTIKTKGGFIMKQIKMNLSEEPKAALKSDEDCRKKQNLRTVRKVLFMVGGGICMLRAWR